MSKAFAEARAQHGESSSSMRSSPRNPTWTTPGTAPPEELKEHGLGHLRDADALLGSEATPEERDDYRRFVVALAGRVAAAHEEHGQDVSPAEAAAIQEIAAALSPAGS